MPSAFRLKHRKSWGQVGITAKREYTKPYRNEELNEKIIGFAKDKMHACCFGIRQARTVDAFDALKKKWKNSLGEELPDETKRSSVITLANCNIM